MKVHELIEELQALDPNKPVVQWGEDMNPLNYPIGCVDDRDDYVILS